MSSASSLHAAIPFVLAALLAATSGCDRSPVETAPPGEELAEPADPPFASADTTLVDSVIPDQFIVALKAQGNPTAVETLFHMVTLGGGTILYRYESIPAFAARLPSDLLAAVLRNPEVASVVPDRVATLAQGGTLTQYTGTVLWGLDRIDQVYRPLNQRYSYQRDGSGVTVYVIDTGIQLSHPDFGGRAVAGFNAAGGDCNGHGTHVAGTIGGTTFGVAKNVKLVAVRVGGCGPTMPISTVIAGVDWVTMHHLPGAPAVANLSLITAAYPMLDAAVSASVADGVTYVVAAGNFAQDACAYSPGHVAAVLTVGWSTPTDTRAAMSNFGPCLALFAPGDDIYSAALGGGGTFMSGTSMAAPHVAGAAALYLQGNPGATPAQVRSAILKAATVSLLGGIGVGSPNRLLHTLEMTARVQYRAHVAGKGWLADVYDGSWGGTMGESRAMEALTVRLVNVPPGIGVCYSVHLEQKLFGKKSKGGWQPEVCNGTTAGTTGQSRRMEAVRIRLVNAPPGMHVCYTAHVAVLGTLAEVCDGAVAGTTGQNRRMEAIRVRIVP